jgi:hypothetical protein
MGTEFQENFGDHTVNYMFGTCEVCPVFDEPMCLTIGKTSTTVFNQCEIKDLEEKLRMRTTQETKLTKTSSLSQGKCEAKTGIYAVKQWLARLFDMSNGSSLLQWLLSRINSWLAKDDTNEMEYES